MTTIEWKWSNGEENSKSYRFKENHSTNSTNSTNSIPDIYTNTNTNEIDNSFQNSNSISNSNSKNAIMQSLENYDTFDFEPMFSRNDNPMGKAREELDDKMSNRELIFQRGTNPFLQTSSYVNDVVTRDAFLKPKNTTFEKIKSIEDNK